MRIFSKNEASTDVSLLTEIPDAITYQPSSAAYAQFREESAQIGCLGCAHPSCLYLSKDDVSCYDIDDFPNDRGNRACPVNALSWDEKNCHPVVDNSKCIACGVCMRRCPIGAIFYDNGVKINSVSCDWQRKMKADSKVLCAHHRQIQHLSSTKRSGCFIRESDEILAEIYDKLSETRSENHNLIGRNLLISLGCHAATRRIGDVYTRMDAVYSSKNNTFGSVEIEFGRDTLDASRAILDDIAILQTRYKISKKNNLPLVICLQLPNARQGYWQVVKDIRNVERIAIETITIGALMILNWNGLSLLPDGETYYLDYDGMNLRKGMEGQLNRKLNISRRFLGVLEPMK